MLRIHKQQMDALSTEALHDYEDRLLPHLRKFFPAYCDSLGEERVRGVIRYGIARAGSHDITLEREVCIYIDAMFAFGRDFDEDPALPWAAAVLNEPSATRGYRLFDVAFEHLDEARGLRVDPEESE